VVDACRDPDGWHFYDRMGGQAYKSEAIGSSSRILMMEFDEAE
jgi:hypothetical protein